MQSDRERAQEFCQFTDHEFAEEYYGYRCTRCGLFYPFGCAPWDDAEDYEPEEYYSEEHYPSDDWFQDHAEDDSEDVPDALMLSR